MIRIRLKSGIILWYVAWILDQSFFVVTLATFGVPFWLVVELTSSVAWSPRNSIWRRIVIEILEPTLMWPIRIGASILGFVPMLIICAVTSVANFLLDAMPIDLNDSNAVAARARRRALSRAALKDELKYARYGRVRSIARMRAS